MLTRDSFGSLIPCHMCLLEPKSSYAIECLLLVNVTQNEGASHALFTAQVVLEHNIMTEDSLKYPITICDNQAPQINCIRLKSN